MAVLMMGWLDDRKSSSKKKDLTGIRTRNQSVHATSSTIELSGLLAASDVPVHYEGWELIKWTRAFFSLDGPLTVILREPATLGCLVASNGSTLLSTVHRECILFLTDLERFY